MIDDDKRLIEDYLPIQDISSESSREKAVRKGHISTLHLWWARRPLAACRAAVFSSLVPLSSFEPTDRTISTAERLRMAREAAAEFVKALCKNPVSSLTLREAEKRILGAHASRISQQSGKEVSFDDILEGKASRPKVLDMFSGGGAIPLEAARLGCESYAVDLNPVAHIVELCTLKYPQQYGAKDDATKGCSKSGSWAGLAAEVSHWGQWVLNKANADLAPIYPHMRSGEQLTQHKTPKLWNTESSEQSRGPELVPVAYVWTRTVTCKNPICGATVPLARQTWLCEKSGRYVALKPHLDRKGKRVRFSVVEAPTVSELGFDPNAGATAGNATCLFCGSVSDNEYVKKEGCEGRLGLQMLAVAFTQEGKRGKTYVAADDHPELIPNATEINKLIAKCCDEASLTPPAEAVPSLDSFTCKTHLYGLRTWADLFTPRQLLSLLTFTKWVKHARIEMLKIGYSEEYARVLTTLLACVLDKQVDFNSSLCVLKVGGGRGIVHTFGRQALPMVWDFAEANPLQPEIASWESSLKEVVSNVEDLANIRPSHVSRGSALRLDFGDQTFDAVITDPPYYDNVSYANLSDFFYVWLKRSIGDLYPNDFATELTPKKSEAIAETSRHGGRQQATRRYEEMMATAFKEAHRVLRPNGNIVVVYAHKSTLGWTTLVDALRNSCFVVTEAWPLDTETKSRLLAQDTASLASSIFIVARKRDANAVGRYESQVRPELESIVQERVRSLWALGISGADLVISAIGAGLRAFTRYAAVEYENGDVVPAETFLAEVEAVVLDAVFARLSDEADGGPARNGLSAVDPATRFYVLWRYTYHAADVDAGDAIVFANGMHVEIDGMHGLCHGPNPLVQKRQAKYRLLDYSARGNDKTLGIPGERAPSLIDALHRLLWLLEERPNEIPDFLASSRVNIEQLRLVAQALAGPALKGGQMGEAATGSELAILTKLIANWRSVTDRGSLFRSVTT